MLLALSLYSVSAAVGSFPTTWSEFEAQDKRSTSSLFDRFKNHFGKHYENDEVEKAHLAIFEERIKTYFDWNADTSHSFLKGINKFTDMNLESRQNYVMPEKIVNLNQPKLTSSSNSNSTALTRTIPSTKNTEVCDLRPFTTAVKDQQSCGSCWAFGTIAAAEASHFLWAMTDAKGNPSSANDAWQLSEQVLLECCGDEYDSAGCGGGGTSGPMQCAVDIGALPSTTSHPYTAVDTAACAHSKTEASAYVSSWYEPCSLDEKCLKSLIGGDDCTTFATTALKTSIQVIDSFYDYNGGVYSVPNCPTNKHNHAVAIVGWGTDASTGMDYWIMRNSWGPEWGLGGYFYMERGVNMCCVACENLFFQ